MPASFPSRHYLSKPSPFTHSNGRLPEKSHLLTAMGQAIREGDGEGDGDSAVACSTKVTWAGSQAERSPQATLHQCPTGRIPIQSAVFEQQQMWASV